MTARQTTIGRGRQIAFTVWAAILSLFFAVTFVGVTVLTIGLWLANRNPDTTPVGDLSFFALGAIVVGAGVIAQLKAPERHAAGVQQALIGMAALTVAGWIGAREEPLVGGALFFLAGAILAGLHPARRELFRLGPPPSLPLTAMSIAAAIPTAGYAAEMLDLARRAGPSCFLGACARGDRFAEMAACAVSIVLVSLLAAFKTSGWKLPAWSAASSAILVGVVSMALPAVPGSFGQVGGMVVVAWGALLAILTERETTAL